MHHDITSNSTLKLEEITASQKETIIKNGVNRLYEQYKISNIIEDPSEYIFDFLVEKGKIKNNNNPKVIEYYQLHIKKATAELKSETIVKTSTSKTERSQIKIDLEEIISGSSPKIIIRAKKNILAEYFDKQILIQTEKIF